MSFDPAFLDDLRARTRVVDVVGRRVTLRRAGREYQGLCPFHAEKGPSFTVREDKGFFHCFGCGAHGDAIAFLMRLDGLSFVDAVEQLAGEAGLMPLRDGRREALAPVVKRRTAEEQAESDAWARRHAAELWRAARPVAGSIGAAYLPARGITIPAPPTLRFVPRLKHKHRPEDGPEQVSHWPAIIAAVWAPDRSLMTCHRHYLALDGAAKAPVPAAKKALGAYAGGAIRLTRPARRLAVGEGVETCLSVAQSFWDDEAGGPLCDGERLAVWSAVSLANLAGGGDDRSTPHPTLPGKRVPSPYPDPERPGLILPDWVEEVILLGDADGDMPTAEALVERAARRHHAAGRRVRIAWPAPGTDFNDMLQGAE